MPIIAPPNPESRQIGDYMTDLELRMKRVESGLRSVQLGNSSLEGSGINMFDAAGNYRGTVGFQGDGTTTVTSQNPNPPPVPSAPTVKQDIAVLIVKHDGSTASGQGNPADFSHLNVYTADPGIPEVRTLRGTITPVPGELVVSGLDYTNYLVDVTAVNLGGKESAHSAVASGTPQMVVSADIIAGAVTELQLAADAVTSAAIAANAVTTTEIADNSISTPKVIAGAINANKIASNSILTAHIVAEAVTASKIMALTITANEIAANAITAGKITAGSITASKLESNMIIATRIIAGSDTGARIEMHPTAGLQGFNSSGTRTFWVDSTTGTFSATGSIQTAFSGSRIIINPNGAAPDTIRFYPNSGSAFASIDAITSGSNAGIEMYSGAASAGTSRGIVIAREDFASLIYGTPSLSTILGDIFVSSGGVGRVRSGRIDMMADENQHSDPGFRFQMTNGITPIIDTIMYYNNSGADEPHIAAPNMNVGLVFSDHVTAGFNERLYITGNAAGTRKDISLYSVLYLGDLVKSTSSRAMKADIQPVRDIDPRQAVRNARAQYFKAPYLDEPAVYDTEGNLVRGPREAPVQMGLISEDLPSEVTVMVSEAHPGIDTLGINTDRLVTMLWQGHGEHRDQFDQYVAGPKWIPDVPNPPTPPTTGATLYCFAGSLYAIFSTGKITKIA